MKTAVYDVGSNSIRLIVFDGRQPVLKRKINCRLGEGIAETGRISADATARAFHALSSLKTLAEEQGVTERSHFAFATEAVRRAENGKEFLAAAEDVFSIAFELLSGEREAEIGLNGVLGGGDGAVLDIGGASSELAVREGGKVVYVKSVKVGVGILRDGFLNDKKGLFSAVKKYAAQYIGAPNIKTLYAIGGTASGCGYVANKLKVYDERLIDGLILNGEFVNGLADELLSVPESERAARYHLDENRAKVLPYGAKLFAEILFFLSPEKVIVSEKGNVEGYFDHLVNLGRIKL